MRATLRASVLFSLLVVNTLFWVIPVYASVLIKLLTPAGTRLRDGVSRIAAWFAQHWALTNTWFGDHLLNVRWEVRLPPGLTPQGQYLVCANHQSWNDIYVLMRSFGRRAPFFKFFLKQQLIWVPVLGLAWWGLDYPFMKRYTREQIERNPALRGRDLETTRRACAKYARLPVAILNFLEGTRFTPEKHDSQNSPYRHLLKPRAGGLAFALSAMGDKLSSLLDVTIVYPEGARSLWEFMAGQVHHVIVEVRSLSVPAELCDGDYESDPAFRERVQEWVAQLWAEKDRRIDQLLAEGRARSSASTSVAA